MSVSKFNPENREWMSLPDLPVFIYQSTLIVVDNTLYACSGFQFHTLDLTNPRRWKTQSLEDIITRDQQELLSNIELPSGCIRHLIDGGKLYFIAEKILVLDLSCLEVELMCDMSKVGDSVDPNECIPELREPFYYHIGHDAVSWQLLSESKTSLSAKGVEDISSKVKKSEESISDETNSPALEETIADSCRTELVVLFAIIEKDEIALHLFRQVIGDADSRTVVRNIRLDERFQKVVQLVNIPRLLSPKR